MKEWLQESSRIHKKSDVNPFTVNVNQEDISVSSEESHINKKWIDANMLKFTELMFKINNSFFFEAYLRNNCICKNIYLIKTSFSSSFTTQPM